MRGPHILAPIPDNPSAVWLERIAPAQRMTVFRILERAAELGRAAGAQEANGQEKAAPGFAGSGAANQESEAIKNENGKLNPSITV